MHRHSCIGQNDNDDDRRDDVMVICNSRDRDFIYSARKKIEHISSKTTNEQILSLSKS